MKLRRRESLISPHQRGGCRSPSDSSQGPCNVFSQNGLNVVAACVDGVQAIKALRALRPDVAVLDMYMPGADGLQVLATANSDNLNTRILFLSAAVSSRVIMTAMAEGACSTLSSRRHRVGTGRRRHHNREQRTPRTRRRQRVAGPAVVHRLGADRPGRAVQAGKREAVGSRAVTAQTAAQHARERRLAGVGKLSPMLA